MAKLGIGLVPEGRQVSPNLTARENLVATAASRRGTDPWTLDKVCALFPRLAERLTNMASQPGGAADARHRSRTDDQSAALDLRRGDRRARASDPRRDLALPHPALAAGQSILVIDKNVEALIRIADRHYLIERGKVVWNGSSRELASAPGTQHRYLGV